MADSPETSDHTCVKSRLESLKASTEPKRSIEDFVGSSPNAKGLPFLLKEYLQLIDWTGRIIRDDKRGAIPQSHPLILERLALSEDSWRKLTTQFEHHFGSWVGSEHIVRQTYLDKHYQRIPSTHSNRQLLG